MFGFFHRWQERRAKERRLRIIQSIHALAQGPNPTMGQLVRILLKEGVKSGTQEYHDLKDMCAREYSHIIMPGDVS